MSMQKKASARTSRATWQAAVLISTLSIAIGSALAATEKSAAKKSDMPRLTDGKPDFNGVWRNDAFGFVNPQRDANGSVLCIVGCPRPKAANGEAPPPAGPPRMAPARPKYKPEFEAKVKELSDKQVQTDPALKCLNPGLPRIGPPAQIVQRPGQIVFLYDDLSGSFFRVIPTDGRPHRKDAEESFLGDSVGHWEGDTLVVEAKNFNDETWLTDNGAFHSKSLKVTERLRRVGEKLEYQAVAEDPEVLAEPWQTRVRTLKSSDELLQEPLPCVEKDLDHVIDGTHHDNPR